MQLSKTQKVVLLYTFWLAPVTKMRAVEWDLFTYERPMTEATVYNINERILSETDEAFVDWSVLKDFIEEQSLGLRQAA